MYRRPRFNPPPRRPDAASASAESNRGSKRPREDDTESAGVIPLTDIHHFKFLDAIQISSVKCKKIFGSSVLTGDISLIVSAFSCATWRSLEAAWNSLNSFCTFSKIPVPVHVSQSFLGNYISWLFLSRGLKHSSVESYLSSLHSIFRIRGQESNAFSSYQTKLLLRGGKNNEFLNSRPKNTRKVMTIELLRIIGHEISKSDWSVDSKRVFWAACCLLFFGSFRVGELLANSESFPTQGRGLMWGDILFRGESILIHIRSPKHVSREGEFVDIFKFQEKSCCPVRVLYSLKSKSQTRIEANSPVFIFNTGRLLTPSSFNDTLRSLLKPHFGVSSSEYSSHSFRAAISSALAKFPGLASEDDIKWRGRWNSSSFKKYTRLKLSERLHLHGKVTTALLSRTAL